MFKKSFRKRSRSEEPLNSMAETVNTENVLHVARRVYVGNLSYRTTWQDLKDYFSRAGTVKYADVLRDGSRSKGCGIVEFETPEEAAAAIQQLNHTDLDGRQIFVREDREDFELRNELGITADVRPAKQRPRSFGGHPSSVGAVAIGRRVWVGNLSYNTTWQMLKDHFKAAGRVVHADVLQDAEGKSKGCGIVEFDAPSDALRAISLLSNSTLDDRQIVVREDREDPGASSASHRMQPAGSRGVGMQPAGSRGVGIPRASGFGPPLPHHHHHHPAAHHSQHGVPVPGPSVSAADGLQIVVHGLDYRMAWQELKDLARSCVSGPVVRADILTNPDGSSKGYGVVAFSSREDAAAAIAQLNGRVIDGRVLTAKYDRFAVQH